MNATLGYVGVCNIVNGICNWIIRVEPAKVMYV